MQKNYYKIFKTIKIVFFDSKTHSTRYANMRLKAALIPIVGKTHGKKAFLYLIQKHAAKYEQIYFIHVR